MTLSNGFEKQQHPSLHFAFIISHYVAQAVLGPMQFSCLHLPNALCLALLPFFMEILHELFIYHQKQLFIALSGCC